MYCYHSKIDFYCDLAYFSGSCVRREHNLLSMCYVFSSLLFHLHEVFSLIGLAKAWLKLGPRGLAWRVNNNILCICQQQCSRILDGLEFLKLMSTLGKLFISICRLLFYSVAIWQFDGQQTWGTVGSDDTVMHTK